MRDRQPSEPNTDVIQGTLDLLILKTLSLAPLHGFGIARRVEQISRAVFKVNAGSLLTALQRLERAGAVDSEWSLVTLLFGVSALDAVTYGGVVALLLATAGIACWLPASRAARIDPSITLRAD